MWETMRTSTLALNGCEWKDSHTHTGRSPRYPLDRSWVGDKDSLDVMEKRKISASAGNQTSIIEPIDSLKGL
jgi:hypothetical protein